jgi:hypothetical protein
VTPWPGTPEKTFHPAGSAGRKKFTINSFASGRFPSYKPGSKGPINRALEGSGTVIEQARQGWGVGVRIGEGSLYDLAVEEILAGGEEAVADEEEVEAAMLLLAQVCKGRRRRFTEMVETAIEAALHERRPRRRRAAT